MIIQVTRNQKVLIESEMSEALKDGSIVYVGQMGVRFTMPDPVAYLNDIIVGFGHKAGRRSLMDLLARANRMSKAIEESGSL